MVLAQFEKWIEGISPWNNIRLQMSLHLVFGKCGEPVGIVCVWDFCHLDGGTGALVKTPVLEKHLSSSPVKFNF